MADVDSIPLLRIADLRKHYGGLRPLRLNVLTLAPGERVTLRGLDASAAEMLTMLVTGAALPDEGSITIAGRNTREIETDTQWLTSLDLFGMVTRRAVLLDSLPLEANLALPFTLSIDPVPPDVRAKVEALAAEVGFGADALHAPVTALPPPDVLRVHLARALAPAPKVLLLEHPTAGLGPTDAAALGQLLAQIGERRGLAWLALTEDAAFIDALGGRRCRLAPGSGEVTEITQTQGWTQW